MEFYVESEIDARQTHLATKETLSRSIFVNSIVRDSQTKEVLGITNKNSLIYIALSIAEHSFEKFKKEPKSRFRSEAQIREVDDFIYSCKEIYHDTDDFSRNMYGVKAKVAHQRSLTFGTFDRFKYIWRALNDALCIGIHDNQYYIFMRAAFLDSIELSAKFCRLENESQRSCDDMYLEQGGLIVDFFKSSKFLFMV
jgi:hypothetical protein